MHCLWAYLSGRRTSVLSWGALGTVDNCALPHASAKISMSLLISSWKLCSTSSWRSVMLISTGLYFAVIQHNRCFAGWPATREVIQQSNDSDECLPIVRLVHTENRLFVLFIDLGGVKTFPTTFACILCRIVGPSLTADSGVMISNYFARPIETNSSPHTQISSYPDIFIHRYIFIHRHILVHRYLHTQVLTNQMNLSSINEGVWRNTGARQQNDITMKLNFSGDTFDLLDILVAH